MSKIVRFHELGDADVLRIEELPVEEPKAGEVRIDVEAIGLNRAEVMFRRGQYLEAPKLPTRLGYEAAGVVGAVGAGVTNVKIGDRVSTLPGFSMTQYGVYGETAIVPAKAVVTYPENLTPEQAAAVWVQYLTGYLALAEVGGLRAGQHVLITAASSSTGIAAIQLGKQLGATVIATTRTSKKKDLLLKHGADHVIATEEEDLASHVRDIVGAKGVEVIYDPIAGGLMEAFAEVAAVRGKIVVYGLLDGGSTPVPWFPILAKSLSIIGYKILDYFESPTMGTPPEPEKADAAVAFIHSRLASGALVPVIARTFPLEEIVEAHRVMESNQQIGKIVVTIR